LGTSAPHDPTGVYQGTIDRLTGTMADVSGQLLQEWKNAPNKESQSTSRVTSASWCLKSSSSRFLGKTTILPRPIPVLFAEDGARDLKFADSLVG
jgi:hypothetical protein